MDNTSSASSFQVVGRDGESVMWETEDANLVPVNGIEAIATGAMKRKLTITMDAELLDRIEATGFFRINCYLAFS